MIASPDQPYNPRPSLFATGLLITMLLVAFSSAHAEGGNAANRDLSGNWEQHRISFRFQVTSWGPACGQRPESYVSPSQDRFQVQDEGHRYQFSSGRFQFGSHRCMSDNAEVHFLSFDAARRVTRCATENHNPKQEHGRYTLRIDSPNRATMVNETSYSWVLKGDQCDVHMVETREFSRLDVPARSPAKESTADTKAHPSPPVAVAPPAPSQPVPQAQAQSPASRGLPSKREPTEPGPHRPAFSFFGFAEGDPEVMDPIPQKGPAAGSGGASVIMKRYDMADMTGQQNRLVLFIGILAMAGMLLVASGLAFWLWRRSPLTTAAPHEDDHNPGRPKGTERHDRARGPSGVPEDQTLRNKTPYAVGQIQQTQPDQEIDDPVDPGESRDTVPMAVLTPPDWSTTSSDPVTMPLPVLQLMVCPVCRSRFGPHQRTCPWDAADLEPQRSDEK